ncbi:MAG: SGNH/GDSL hydrolase family protein [Lysobacter sp.]
MAAVDWLALGDSYTIGEGVAEAARWPVRLAAQLRDAGIDIASPRILATTGWTTDELSSAMDAAEPLGSWDFVSLLIGVNNQYRGRSVADYRGEFHDLLRRAIALTGQRAERVLVLSIPDWGVTPFAATAGRDSALIGRELDAYNAAAAALCTTHNVAFVDIAPISRAHGRESVMLVDDGLHPSASMYALWAAKALPIVRALLAPEQANAPNGADPR